MQAHKTHTDVRAINATQSTAAIQTLLRAGLGCIAFLRNLLPEDNFTESHFTTADDSLPYQSSESSVTSTNSIQRRKVNGFKIMTMTRGYTDEADKLMNYLEYGIFDALQKQYLRSFIFAIYLDNKDPNNIVEAYTFNFHYHAIPGTETVLPIMSLGDGLQKMSLKETGGHDDDPTTEAARRGVAPTLRDVKKSVKTLLKTLIHCTMQMDELPKRRFATFKVFYTDETPADYEPPQFQAGDAEKNKWFFMTHGFDEVPDKWSVGRVDTGHHSVNLSVTSVATYLPSSTEHDGDTFAGTTSRRAVPPTLTPAQEVSLRAKQTEKQIKDADARNVAWSVEEAVEVGDDDADGDDDPDYIKQPDGSYVKIIHEATLGSMVPVGLRNELGVIEPLDIPKNIDEALFGGISEIVPTRLNEINTNQAAPKVPELDQTQLILGDTQELPEPPPLCDTLPPYFPVASNTEHEKDSLEPSLPPSNTPFMSATTIRSDVATLLKGVVIDSAQEVVDAEMLDMETQMMTPYAVHQSIESIDSFGSNTGVGAIEGDALAATPKPTQERPNQEQVIDRGIECECGVSMEDESCFCEGGCGRWYHLWCMGYHSTKDTQIPSKFICFDCRLRADVSWELIKVDLYPKMLSRFKDLALFRRAIKVAENEKPATPTEFAKAIGGDNVLARQLFKRLEMEGFITEYATTIDELGLPEMRARSPKGKGGKGKGKHGRNRKNVQKPKYVFNHLAKSMPQYSDYFNPDPKVESRMLGLSELKVASRVKLPAPTIPDYGARMAPPVAFEFIPTGSQTQDETQATPTNESSVQRKRTTVDFNHDPSTRPNKKVKVSVTEGVDLAE